MTATSSAFSDSVSFPPATGSSAPPTSSRTVPEAWPLSAMTASVSRPLSLNTVRYFSPKRSTRTFGFRIGRG